MTVVTLSVLGLQSWDCAFFDSSAPLVKTLPYTLTCIHSRNEPECTYVFVWPPIVPLVNSTQTSTRCMLLACTLRLQ